MLRGEPETDQQDRGALRVAKGGRMPGGVRPSDPEDHREPQAELGKRGSSCEGLRGECVGGSVEAPAHGEPVEFPSGEGQAGEHLFQEPLHLRAVKPALRRAIPDDGQVVACDRGAPKARSPAPFHEE